MALAGAFLVMICVPLLGLILGLDRTFVLEENRNLAAWPTVKPDRSTLGALPAKLEAYFNDQFGFRKRLIYWLAIAKVQGLGVTSTPGVTLGTNGWLYLASDSAVLSFRAARPFTDEQLRRVPAKDRGEARLARGTRHSLSARHPAQQGHDLSGIHARRL